MELDERHKGLLDLIAKRGITFAELEKFMKDCPSGECAQCGHIICPYGEPLHFHHDGCPSCTDDDATSHLTDEAFMEMLAVMVVRGEEPKLPTLYNWFLSSVGKTNLTRKEFYEGKVSIIAQIKDDHRGRPDGRWVQTSELKHFDSDRVETQNTTYTLAYQASEEVIEKVLSGEFGGDRGPPYVDLDTLLTNLLN